jgi:hypothetical protein
MTYLDGEYIFLIETRSKTITQFNVGATSDTSGWYKASLIVYCECFKMVKFRQVIISNKTLFY